MFIVLSDPSLWPTINQNRAVGYWSIAASIVVVYDWVLTLGQEIELIWKQRWSLMTVLYLVIRYIGILYPVMSILGNDMYYAMNGINIVIFAMLGVIMIFRLYAMYQGSRGILIFLVIIFLAVNIACGVITTIALKHLVGEELILSGTYMCSYEFEDDIQLLTSMIWMLNTVWEALALCLSVWISVKHFRDRRRLSPSTGSTIGDCFTVLIKSHVLYFASFVGVSCLQLSSLSTKLTNSNFVVAQILPGALKIFLGVEMFVLGPHLILSIREYHAKLVAKSDAETSMASIVFQERVHVPTSSTV
ncbi:hypothetical protein BD769DRAFT_1776014 [Suillus cothurnatus]|nr:hypothetical protein BD769DRAFT_1776014 [Suillus cothurnatus]